VKFAVVVTVPFVAEMVAVVVPLGVPPVPPFPPPPELPPPPLHPAHPRMATNAISAKAVLNRCRRPRDPTNIAPAQNKKASAVNWLGVHLLGPGTLNAGTMLEAVVLTSTVTVCVGLAGVRVTDAGLVAGFVVNVHVASAGRTGH